MKWQYLHGCRRLRQFGATLAAMTAAMMLPSGCLKPESGRPSGPSETITLGLTREPLGALLVIADEQGFFADQGLNVLVVDTYPSGKRALEGLLDGDVEAAPCAETPVVFRSFKRNDFAIVATIGYSDNEAKIVAHNGRGIEKPQDLRGKRLATQRGSAVHYFLHLFLLRHGMSEDDVTLSYLPAEELPEALAEDQIDAFSMREPFLTEAERMLGGAAVVFCEPRLYVKTFHLVVARKVIEERPEAVRRMLRALIEAEDFVRRHRHESVAIVARRLNVDPGSLSAAWTQLELRVSLGQELFSALEDEARWAMESGLVDDSRMPNYSGFVYADALEEVDPTDVTVID